MRPTDRLAADWAGRALRLGCALLCCLACLLIVYRVQILSSGNLLAGDLIDVRIADALEDHWFNVFRGLEPWNQPLYFSPVADTLGYNDGYLLFGVFHALARACGADVLLAGELSGAAFRFIGFAGMLCFGRLALRLPFGWAVLAACIATLSNAMFLQMGHVQMLSAELAPLLGCLLWLALQGKRLILWSCLAALLVDAWLLTAFYTIWFTALFTLLAAAAVLAMRPAAVWRGVRRLRPQRLLPAAALLLLGLAPFAMVYLPKARETGMHPASLALAFTPSVIDLLHVGSGNLLYGWLDIRLAAALRPGFPDLGEFTIGSPPLLLGLALAAAMLAVAQRGKTPAWRTALAAGFLLSLLLSVRIGHITLWRLVYAAVPGAAAVRVVCRFMLLLDLAAILLAVDALARLARRRPRAAVALAALLLAGEINAGGNFAVDRSAELHFLAAVPPPPPRCQSFVLMRPRDSGGPDAALNLGVDAMLLAEELHLPTLNGHASFLPASFTLGYTTEERYAAQLRQLALQDGLRHSLCGLDPRAMTWDPAPVQVARLVPGQPLGFGVAGAATPYLLAGWSDAEPAGRWTDANQAELLMDAGQPRSDLALSLDASAFHPGTVELSANGETVAAWRLAGPPQRLTAVIPHRLIGQDGLLRLRFAIAEPRRPIDAGQGSQDTRLLGLFAETLQLTEDASRSAAR